MTYLSPLRYPGGKGRFAPFLARVLAAQNPRPSRYAEPFAGGAGAALRLLAEEEVRSIAINDLSVGIASFWREVFYNTEDFAQRVETEHASIDRWHHWRSVFEDPGAHEQRDIGFATFFLNRCNRSGILTARPIGGLDQTGRWKIDARFNRENLAARIRFLGSYRRRVSVTQLDGRDFVHTLEDDASSVLLYVDPPYLGQGDDLYLDSLTESDHANLAATLRASQLRWLLTYDVDTRVTSDLYAGLRTVEFRIAHTAAKQHVGSELAVFSDSLAVPDVTMLRRANARWIAS